MTRDLIDPHSLADIFFSGIGAIERVGATNLRITLFVLAESQSEKQIVAKLIATEGVVRSMVQEIHQMLAHLPRRETH